MFEQNQQGNNFDHPKHHFLHLIVIPASILGAVVFIGTVYWIYSAYQTSFPDVVVCTQEAMQCPDGSYVGRTRPNCEFVKCPDATSELTGNKCISMGGKIVNTLGFEEWNQEDYIADVIGMRCPCICVKDNTVVDTSDWKTYRNEEFGFEVKYPEFADIKEFNQKNTVIYNFTIQFYQEPHKVESGVLLDKALISVSRSPLPLRQDISKSDEKFTTLTILSRNKVVVNNVPAEKILLLTRLDASKAKEFFGADSTFDFEVRDWVVSFEHNGYFYQISTSAEERESEQFLDSLLSTFKFIK